MKANAHVMFSSVDAAEAAERRREAFSVYLLRDFDYSIVERAMRKSYSRSWWSLGDADAFHVGRVVITVSESNLAAATAFFRVPDIPSGNYAVMFCDAGCRNPLADVIPTAPNQLTVTAAGTTGMSPPGQAAWLALGLILGVTLGFLLGRRRRRSRMEPPWERMPRARGSVGLARGHATNRRHRLAAGRQPARHRRRDGGQAAPRAEASASSGRGAR